MDTEALVNPPNNWWDKQKNRINQLLSDAIANGLDVCAAGWLQTLEDGNPYLYLVSPIAESGTTEDGYKILQSLLSSTQVRWIRLTEIKFVRSSSLLGRGLMRIAQRETDGDGIPVIYTSSDLNGVEIIGQALIFAPLTKTIPAASN
jgi:hypothetical protein